MVNRARRPFVAHPPPRDPERSVEWNARQWREIAAMMQEMTAKIEELESRIAALE